MNKFIKLLLMCVINIFSVLSKRTCDKYGVLFYEELGCKPEFERARNCPSYYNCPKYKNNANTSNYLGRIYNITEGLEHNITSPACYVLCDCNGGNIFECADPECEESNSPFENNCYYKYSLDECCSIGQVCELEKHVPLCEYEGSFYKEFEMFYPDDQCYSCICLPGFNGTLIAPYCRPQLCGFELTNAKYIEQNCAPVYTERSNKLCCPYLFACPTDNEEIHANLNNKKIGTEKKCKFGEKEISYGDYFQTKVKHFDDHMINVNCTCEIPPLTYCVFAK